VLGDGAATKNLLRLQDCLVGLDEYAAEKRSKYREASLRKLFKALSQFATSDMARELVYDQLEHVRSACLHGIRSGDPPEQYASCRVLEATSVVLGGANLDDDNGRLDRQLRRVVDTSTRAIPVRIAAMRALTMACFLSHDHTDTGDTDSYGAEALMDLWEQVASREFRGESVGATMRAAALDCWSILATTLSDFDLAGQNEEQIGRGLSVLALLRECLDSSSVELRSAAGECVSLIHESRLSLGVSGDDSANVTARRFRRGSWDGSQWEVLMDEVRQRIAELSVTSGHHMSKKAKKEQRATFREFMATIVEDESPEESVSFRNGTLSLHSWREIIPLNYVRHCLQGGFQVQLLTNPALQSIFGANGAMLGGLDGVPVATLSSVEKRLVLSKTSDAAKSAHVDMTRQRRKRENVKNHFLTADGEDL
jgi:Interferon-related developmental regulator (IFRD)